MSSLTDAWKTKAEPWWPEVFLYGAGLVIAISMVILDFAGRLGGGHTVLPPTWSISKYEFEVLIAGPFLVVCMQILGMRRFAFDGHTLFVSRMLLPRSTLAIPLTDILTVSTGALFRASARQRSARRYDIKCAGGRTVRVPTKYVGAEELVAAIQQQKESGAHHS